MTGRPPKILRSDLESTLQGKILHWLKAQGCFACKMQQNATTQAGIADVFFCLEGFYGFLEVKKAKSSPRRPGQEAFVKKMNEWSYARVVYPENWEEVKQELSVMLK